MNIEKNHKNHHIIVIMLSTIVIVCSATSLALSYCRFFQIFDKASVTGIFQCCYLSLCQ